jgi:enoyl-CoA hydratase
MSESRRAGSEVIAVERDGHVAIVWLDRADKRNAMAHEFWADLPELFDDLSRDDAVRAVVIAARGPAFTVGIDLVAFGADLAAGAFGETMANDVAARRAFKEMLERMQRTFSAVADCTKPVIAAVHGYCLGAGVDLISACDIRLAAADAVFSVRETRMAMVADVGTLQRLPTILDPGTVAELVYTGRDVGADEAQSVGLVSRVYPDAATTVEEAVRLAKEIAANSPLAVQGAKAVLRAQRRSAERDSLEHVALWNSAFFHSNDLAEAIRAFMEKRTPDFDGS